jgi:hypothetical protein
MEDTRKRKSDEIEKGFQQGLTNITRDKIDPEAQIFIDVGVDPKAPIDPEIDNVIINRLGKKARADDELFANLAKNSDAQIGGGKRRRTRRRSKKSKKRKTKRRRYRK